MATNHLRQRSLAASTGNSVLSIGVPTPSQKDWDASRRPPLTPLGATSSVSVPIVDNRAHSKSARVSTLSTRYHAEHNYRPGYIHDGSALEKEYMLGSQGIVENTGPVYTFPSEPCSSRSSRQRWLHQINPIRPLQWLVRHHGDVVNKGGKVVQNFWVWIAAIAIFAGTVGFNGESVTNANDHYGNENSTYGCNGGKTSINLPSKRSVYPVLSGNQTRQTRYGAASFMG